MLTLNVKVGKGVAIGGGRVEVVKHDGEHLEVAVSEGRGIRTVNARVGDWVGFMGGRFQVRWSTSRRPLKATGLEWRGLAMCFDYPRSVRVVLEAA